MVTVIVDLGSITVKGKHPGLSLALSSSAMIALPPSWDWSPPTARELCEASAAGKIWVAKAGSCRVDFAANVNDGLLNDIFGQATMTAIVNLPSECPVWNELGLELRSNHADNGDHQQNSVQASYFLHHPDLSSEMIAPPAIPLARFQGLKCEVNYYFGISPSKSNAKSTQTSAKSLRRESPPLPRPPRPSKKPFKKYEPQGPASRELSPPPSQENSERDAIEQALESFTSATLLTELTSLLDLALGKLIGVRRAPSGVGVTKRTLQLSLIDIAPAVWNLHYLQTMTAHSSIVPSIVSGIMRLSNAQSSILRQKLERLASCEGRAKDGHADVTDSSEGIIRRLWLLCQTRIRGDIRVPQPRKRPDSKRMATQPQLRPVQTDTSSTNNSEHSDVSDDESVIELGINDRLPDNSPLVEAPQPLLEGFDLSQAYELMNEEIQESAWRDHDLATNDWISSSEGDYFYADGLGNVIPVEKHTALKKDEISWADDEIEHEEPYGQPDIGIFAHGDNEIDLDENEDQAYIMYDEQNWFLAHEAPYQDQDQGPSFHPLPPQPYDDPL